MNVTEMSLDERQALLTSIEKDVKTLGGVAFVHSDTDGKASMYVLRMKFPKVKCFTVNHGKQLPLHLILPRQVIFMLDFSFPEEDVKRLIASGHRIIHCDHHEPINTYPLSGLNLEGNSRIEVGTSGASLTYELLYPNATIPKAVEYIANYDTWKLDDPDVLYFNIGFQLLGMELDYTSDQTWLKLCTDSDFLQRVVDAGKHISIFDKARADIMATECGFKTEVDGVPALAINAKNSNSKVLDTLDPEGKVPFRLLYAFFGNIKKYRVGIYSSDETKYDAGAYARKFGGDGRASAAGFVCTELPFPLPKPNDAFMPEYTFAFDPLKRMIAEDPLVRRHSDIQLRQIIRSIHMPMSYLGWKASFLNHPYLLVDGWYMTNLNFSYDIGCIWSMLKNGWFKLIIYPLKDSITLDEIAKRSGGKIVNDSVIVYQKEMPLKDLL